MKQYESPVVQQVDDIIEGIYVASGASPTPVPTPIPTEPPAGEWNYSNAEWRGHNGGSHSEGHIDLHYSGPGQTVQGVEVNCITNFDFEMDLLDGCGSCEITATSSRSFTIRRINSCLLNAGENIGINFKIVAYVPEYIKENGTQGAVGDSAAPNATKYIFTIVSVRSI